MRAPLHRHFVLLATLVACMCAPLVSASAAHAATSRLIVGFDPGTTTAERADALADADVDGATNPLAHLRATAIEVPSVERSSIVAALRSEADVAYVVADAPVELLWAPNDPRLADQYGLDLLNVPEAWDSARGSGITIAIVDSGVEQGDAEFAGRVVAGYDFVNDDSNPEDDHGHGTHVAGIAAAGANDGLGVAGVAPEASIMPIKVLAANGSGWTSEIAEGITWAADHGADVINLSVGGETDPGNLMKTALAYAKTQGAQGFCAAGNQHVNSLLYPARLDECVSVAATDSLDALSNFSNTGTGLDVSAPGVGILSSVMGAGYQAWDGTSMATPLVSGAAALLMSWGVPAADIQAALQSSADDLGVAGYDTNFGYGRVDLLAALGLPSCDALSMPVTEDTPAEIAPSCHDVDSVNLTYSIVNQPSTKGTASVTGAGNLRFVPTQDALGATSFTYRATDPDTHASVARTVSVTISNTADAPVAVNDVSPSLPNNSAVSVNVLGNDSDPDGPLAAVATVTVTQQPTHGSATVNGSNQVVVTPAVGYLGADSLTYRVCDATPLCDDATVSLTWTEGNDAPSAPTGLLATQAVFTTAGQVTLSWTASTDPDPGDSIAHYVVSTAPSSSGPWTDYGSFDDTTAIVVGMSAASTTWFRVRAVDSFGLAGANSSATSMTVPKAPTTLSIYQRSPSGSRKSCGTKTKSQCVYQYGTMVRLGGAFTPAALHKGNTITVRLSRVESGSWHSRLVRTFNSSSTGAFAASVIGSGLKRGNWRAVVSYAGSSTSLPTSSAPTYFRVR